MKERRVMLKRLVVVADGYPRHSRAVSRHLDDFYRPDAS